MNFASASRVDGSDIGKLGVRFCGEKEFRRGISDSHGLSRLSALIGGLLEEAKESEASAWSKEEGRGNTA